MPDDIARCGPDQTRDTDERNAFFCTCNSPDPEHRWFAKDADPSLGHFALSDSTGDLVWEHGSVRRVADSPLHADGGFCGTCLRTTFPDSGGCFSLNGFGTAFRGNKYPCPACGSVIVQKWVVLFFLPVFPLERYRIIRGTYTPGFPVSRQALQSRRVPPFIDP